MKLEVGTFGLRVRGWIPLDEAKALVDSGKVLEFGYYGDATLEKSEDNYVVQNTVTGTIVYNGPDFKEAFFTARRIGKRYNDLNDKYFHNEWEKTILRGR